MVIIWEVGERLTILAYISDWHQRVGIIVVKQTLELMEVMLILFWRRTQTSNWGASPKESYLNCDECQGLALMLVTVGARIQVVFIQ
jgi:hypothetical protein